MVLPRRIVFSALSVSSLATQASAFLATQQQDQDGGSTTVSVKVSSEKKAAPAASSTSVKLTGPSVCLICMTIFRACM